MYELPKQELVFGPLQVESRIDQEPRISEQFSLWNQGGSNVIRGNLLVIPINQSFLYVEPIYLRADTSALPELKRVIVATDTRIVMETTLDRALAALLLADPGEVVVEVEEGAVDVAETEDGDDIEIEAEPIAGELDTSVAELIQSANDHFVAAEQAQQNGDWATYGVELNALESDLQRLIELTGE